MSVETDKMNLRSTLKSLEYEKSRLACKMAEDVGISGYFFSDDLPLDDPRLNASDVARFEFLCDRIYQVSWDLDKLVNPECHEARQTCFDFINLLGLEEGVKFLRKAQCLNTFELVEKVDKNPNFIQEVLNNDGVRV